MKGADKLVGEEWTSSPECLAIGVNLKEVLEGLMDHLFCETEKKWSDDYSLFMTPS